MRKIILANVLLFLSSCATYDIPMSVEGEDRVKLEGTKSAIDAVRDCAKEAKSNDAYFSKNCTKLLDGKWLYGKFVSARSSWRRYTVEVEGYFNATLDCDTDQKNASAVISKFKQGSPVMVKGRLQGYSQIYVNGSSSGRPSIDISSCYVKSSPINYPKY